MFKSSFVALSANPNARFSRLIPVNLAVKLTLIAGALQTQKQIAKIHDYCKTALLNLENAQRATACRSARFVEVTGMTKRKCIRSALGLLSGPVIIGAAITGIAIGGIAVSSASAQISPGQCGAYNSYGLLVDPLDCPPCPAGTAPALVYVNGRETDSTTQLTCLANLGVYSPETGLLTNSNFDSGTQRYLLNGKYVNTNTLTLAPNVARFGSQSNNFLVDPNGVNAVSARPAAIAGAEVHLYYYINRFRMHVLTDSFIQSLNLPAAARSNVMNRQFNPALVGMTNARVPSAIVRETSEFTPWSTGILSNQLVAAIKPRSAVADPLDSAAFDPEYVVGQYAGLVANWISADNAPWPTDPNFGNVGDLGWRTDIRPAILEGFKLWNAYNYSKRTELHRYAMRSARRWTGSTCGTEVSAACNKGWVINNTMMYSDTADAAATLPSNDDSLLFPLKVRGGVPANHNGPKNAELGGMLIGALFYDLSKEVGIGDQRTNLLFWKTMSLLNPGQPISITQLGATVQTAARALFPTANNPALSWYEQDIIELFASRGVRMNGATNFFSNLPAVVNSSPEGTTGTTGTMGTASVNGIGSAIPEGNGNDSTGYNWLTFFTNSYTVSTPGTQYVTYQFYKHSKYGPCDSLDVTNGSISAINSVNPSMDYNGSMAVKLEGRTLGNTILMAPGGTLRFNRNRQTCVDEREGYYAEDGRPFGFRVVNVIPNGFTITVKGNRSGMTADDSASFSKVARLHGVLYDFSIVDPSVTMTGANTGPAVYNWTFTSFDGRVTSATGTSVAYSALAEQPLTIRVARVRGGQTETITLRERGSDLDRNNGQQFNQDFVNSGYRVGFDTIVNKRMAKGPGAYKSALNSVGVAAGTQARLWKTPNRMVQPLRFSTVSVAEGTLGSPYNFAAATYYNACIWGSRNSVTSFPGCANNAADDNFEVRVPFSQVGIDLTAPVLSLNAGLNTLPGYLWTVNYPSTWRLAANKEYYFGSHIAANSTNGESFNHCSLIRAHGTVGQTNGLNQDRSDWLAGIAWNGSNGNPAAQTMRSYLANQNSIRDCTFSAYRFEGKTAP